MYRALVAVVVILAVFGVFGKSTVTAPDVGEKVDGDSNGLSAAALLALLGATMACGAGLFGMRKRHRKA